MSFSSLPRRIALPLSSRPSYRSLRCTRFVSTVPNLSVFEERVNDESVEVRDASKRVFPQRATEHGIDSAGRSSEPSITESYLLSLLTDGTVPTLHDLERLKPSEHSDPQSTAYTREHKALLDNICRSFSNDQLRSFSQQYALQLGSKPKKRLFAEAIVEKAWHWPPLRELKRAKKDRTEVASRTLALTTSELFILLGKDGSDWLELSRKYNVHISVKRNPLAIYLEGSRESLKAVEKHVEDVQKSIVEDIVDTLSEHPVSQEVLQRTSRLSGAFVENAGSQKLRIRAKHRTNIILAQRLAVRLHYETEPSELLAQKIHDQEFHMPTAAPVAYALYPFAAPRSLSPMKSNTFLRWRRVGDWLGDGRSQSLEISGLAHSQSNILSMDWTGVCLRQRLTENASMPSYGSTRLISVLSGHILFPAPRTDARPSLLTPHTGGPGGSTYSDTHSWVSTEQMSATFVPSLPFELVKAIPSQQRVLHRLVYRCFPALDQHKGDALATHFIRLEVPLVDLKQAQLPLGASGGSVLANTLFWNGSSTNLDILMPDRLMDLRFTISDMNSLTSDRLPGEILKYLNDLEKFLTSSDLEVAQPAPPLHVSYDNRQYVLVTNASVRQSMESSSYDPSPGIAVTSESTLDLESGHLSAVCVSKVSSDHLDSPQKWNAFLQSCDQMTTGTS